MRNLHIDRLRGISIFMVLFGHSLRYSGFWSDKLPGWLNAHIEQGALLGVTLFFVISGYLITSKFVRSPEREFTIEPRGFYVQRIGRILPPLAALIAFNVAFEAYQGNLPTLYNLFKGVLFIIIFDFNSFSTLVPHVESSFDQLWSLGVEEGFYIYLPMVCLAVGTRSNLSYLMVAIFIYGTFGRIFGFGVYVYATTFDQLATGVLVAVLTHSPEHKDRPHRCKYLMPLALALMILVYLYMNVANPFTIMMMAMSGGVYMFGTSFGPGKFNLLLWPLEQMGRVSYEVYLVHYIVLLATNDFALQWRTIDGWALENWLVLGMRFLLIYAVAAALEKFISIPANRFIRRTLGGATAMAPAVT